ncbi:MAG: DUF5011 domain-containing protein, partial [Candidatus Marinimicrobia bacterium]|nr:DUF5011 domain-containing protein [Candidatus Neomarinimicrobiota bacterium]
SGWDFTTLWNGSVNIATKHGLDLNAVSNSNFSNNTFDGIGVGIYVLGAGSYTTVHNNSMIGCGSGFASQTYANNNQWTITDNIMTNSPSSWAISYNGSPLEVSGNDFTGSVNGIYFQGANNFTMQGNSNVWDLAGGGTALSINYTNGFTVDGLTAVGGGNRAVSVTNSNNIMVDGLETCGYNEGIYFQAGSGHTVKNSSFSEAGSGVTVYPNTTVSVIDNNFHNVSTDVSYNPTNTNVTISGSQTVSSATWCPAAPNALPVADAGADQLIESLTGSENVSLDGTGSSDPDQDNLTYSWVLNGSEVSQAASFTTSLGYGVHTFTLTVDDGISGTDNDDVVVSIVDPLVAYWKAEGNGVDETPNNNDVSPAGSGAVTYCIGADGQGFEFTGSNWMEIADKPSLNIGTGDLAIVMWAKLTGASGIETLLDKRDPSNGFKGYVVYTINNGFVGAQINTGNNYLNWISPINIADSQWHHIVFTIDRDNTAGGYITVDGTQTYTFDPTGFVGDVNNAAPLRIGGRNDGLENWVGCIDDVRLYNHAFTPTEIADDFNNVTPPTNAAPIADAGNDMELGCVLESAEVTLDGSDSSDPDDDALTYSWSLGGNEVSTLASFTASLAPGTYTYTLTVNDGTLSASAEVTITLNADTQAPTLALTGDNPFSLPMYTIFTDPGFTVSDNCDGDPSVTSVSNLNENIPGSYTLTYTATDAGGNASTAERIVNVINTAPTADPVSEVILSFGEDLLTADLDLATVFADVDVNDVLSYAFTSSNATVASVSLSGSVLSMSALDLGVSNISITATDPWGAHVTTYFTLTVNVTSTLADALLFAQSEIKIKKDVEVYSGNLLVNEGSSHGNHHDDDEDDDEDDDNDEDDDRHGNGHDDDGDDHGRYQLSLDKDSHVAPGYALMADRIDIKQNTLVESDVYANDLDNSGDITGDIFGDIVTPLFATLPPFKSGAAGSQNITVNKNQTLELAPGDYGRIYVKDRGTITFTGGIYNIEKLEAQKSSHVRFETATEVRVEDEVKLAKNTYVGPAGGSYIGASDIIFYISGDHHHSAKLEEDVVFYGTIYSQEGEVELKKDVSFTGSILAEKISIDKDCELTVDSYFSSTSGGGVSKAAGRLAWVEPEMEAEIPLASGLNGNYPNPFNPSTSIDFALSQAGQVSLKIYDIRGAEVADLARGFHEAGYYSISFSPENLSSGTYLYVLDSGSFREVKRMVYLK